MTKNKALSIYIHIPFCIKKCLYCDFVSACENEDVQVEYVNNLVKEMIEKSSLFAMHEVITIFIGGGTPSILSTQNIEKIMKTIKTYYNLSNDMEITMEMNPATVVGDVLYKKMEGYIKSGINRLSIGLQSANNEELRILGRPHNFEDFLNTYRAARGVGFENINIDLMAAIPKQTLESYERTLKTVCELKPQHISAYSLIIEEGTPFYDMYENGELSKDLVDEDTERQMYYRTVEIMKEYGYNRYEISNYSLPGYECEHNKVYWTRGDYIGFGEAAASMIDNVRWTNEPDYSPPNKLSINEQMEEFMFLGLRMCEGISISEFKNEFKVDIIEKYGKILKKLASEGLIIWNENSIKLTNRGIDVSNYVMAQFLM